MNRPLYHPTPDEIMRACEVLMCHGLAQEARRTVLTKYAEACRDCAKGLIRTAKSRKEWAGHDAEVKRLLHKARWYWRCYTREIVQ